MSQNLSLTISQGQQFNILLTQPKESELMIMQPFIVAASLNGSLPIYELATGVVNGVNSVFGSSFVFDPDYLLVYDMVLLSRPEDYTIESSNSIRLTSPPLPGEKIFLNYRKLI